MIKHIINILNGANRHWNETNNAVINHFWQDSEKLNEMYKLVAQEFIVASHTISNCLLGPDRNKLTSEKIKQNNINKLTINDFYNFYIRLLAIFYSLLIENNTYNSGNIFKSLSVLIDHKIEPITVDESIPVDRKNEKIISIGIKGIANNLDFINNNDPKYNYSMVTLILATYSEFMKNIKEKLTE